MTTEQAKAKLEDLERIYTEQSELRDRIFDKIKVLQILHPFVLKKGILFFLYKREIRQKYQNLQKLHEEATDKLTATIYAKQFFERGLEDDNKLEQTEEQKKIERDENNGLIDWLKV